MAVRHVELDGVTKAYGEIRAVDGVSVSVDQGECLALLGPSGCGKTTTLNLVAGFLWPDRGQIRIGGRPVDRVPAHRRNTGMVFQNYALFPHLTVFENVAFGLRERRVEPGEIRRRVQGVLGLVRLPGFEARYPRQLSGGQQQRVALARALVIHPDVLLLDEPLSNLDAKLRQEMRVELVEILKKVGITTIFVTHDQEEALALSDRLAIMNAGRIEQVGTPVEVYENPETGFVARFMGESNVFPGRVVEKGAGRLVVEVEGGGRIVSTRKTTVSVGDAVEVVVRPERVRLGRTPQGWENAVPVLVDRVVFLGADIRYLVTWGGFKLVVRAPNQGGDAILPSREGLILEWPGEASLVSPAGSA